MAVRYLTIRKFALETGYSEDAIRTKIRDGVWPETDVWVKAPDGRVLVDVEGYNEWASSTMVFGRPRRRQSRSTSAIAGCAAAKGSGSSPPPLIGSAQRTTAPPRRVP